MVDVDFEVEPGHLPRFRGGKVYHAALSHVRLEALGFRLAGIRASGALRGFKVDSGILNPRPKP